MPLRIVPPFVFGCLAAFCATQLGAAPHWAATFAIAAVLLLGWSIIATVQYRREKRYDLKELARVHDQFVPEGETELELPDDASIMCAKCGHVYDSRILVCPNCKSSAIGGWCG